MSSRVRTALGLRMSTDRRAPAPDELADLARAVGADALLPALRAAALPRDEVRALVCHAIDLKTMTVHGARIDNLRAAVSAAVFWRNQ